MEVIITEWALQSYLDLKTKGIFTEQDYREILRPDAELLKTDDPFDANHPRFSNAKFWGPATNKGQIIKYGYKMKWHNFGPGRNQLRLCIVIVITELEGKTEQRAFICTGYVKDASREKREMARLKIKIQKILDGTYSYQGENMNFKTTASQRVHLYQIASAMKASGLSDQFIADAVQLGEYYEGVYDLFELWQDSDAGERAEIVSDIQEEIYEAQEQPTKPQHKPMVHFEDLDRIAQDVIGFKKHLRNLVDQWGGISKLAEATGITQPSLSRFFGSASMPRRTTLYRIAIAMNLSETEVVGSWAA